MPQKKISKSMHVADSGEQTTHFSQEKKRAREWILQRINMHTEKLKCVRLNGIQSWTKQNENCFYERVRETLCQWMLKILNY